MQRQNENKYPSQNENMTIKKRLLLITVKMDGYEKEIIETFERKGFAVDFFPQAAKIHKSEFTLKDKLIRIISKIIEIQHIKSKMDAVEKNIYGRYISQLADKYDMVFDFAGKGRRNCLQILRKKYKCPFILYLWDDLKHQKNAKENFQFFDKIFTYNQLDADLHGLIYRPNFFLSIYEYKNEPKNIDIFYKGTLRDKKRSIIINKIIDAARDFNVEISLYTRNGFLKNIRKVHSYTFFKKYCNNERMSVDKIAEKSKNSKVLIDITFKSQEGLGLRPIEAIAAKCKIITTNKNIYKYSIYFGNNVFLLNETLSNIDKIPDFIKSEFTPPHNELVKYFHVESFVDDIINKTNNMKPRPTLNQATAKNANT